MNEPLALDLDRDATPSLLAGSSRRQLAKVGTAQLTVSSPLGDLLLIRTERGLAGVWFAGQKHHPGPLGLAEAPDDPLLRRAADQLLGHLNGGPAGFDVPLDLQGTSFQRAVWQALLEIPSGVTRSYRDIAQGIGAVAALRAVGSAIGRNPVSVIVPCHRVLGSDGSLTGYAGGLGRKQALLALERAQNRLDV